MSAELHSFSQSDNVVRTLPHALGIEKAVISVMLQSPELLDEVAHLTEAHFYLLSHQTMFAKICATVRDGKPLELVSFIQSLLTAGQLDRVGGPSAVCDVYNYQPTPAHFTHHVEILSGFLARRMTIQAANGMIAAAYESEDAASIIDATSSPISEIHDVLTGNRSAQSTKTVVNECIEQFQRRCQNQETPMGFETSLTELNKRFNGLHRKQTVVISGYPGGGKTTLAVQLALDAATDGHNTLVCSLEMPAKDLVTRAIAYLARRPGLAITDPIKYSREVLGTDGPTKDLLQAVKNAALKLAAAAFHVEDLVGANAYKIAACIRRAHRKRPLDIVVVDYAQRIRPAPEKVKESREQQLSHASNHLSDLAKELGFCLLLPSQLNKEGAAKHAEAINEDADLHLQIAQDRNGQAPTYEHIGIAVMKDRHHGQDGEMLPIVLDAPMVRFVPKLFPK